MTSPLKYPSGICGDDGCGLPVAKLYQTSRPSLLSFSRTGNSLKKPSKGRSVALVFTCG